MGGNETPFLMSNRDVEMRTMKTWFGRKAENCSRWSSKSSCGSPVVFQVDPDLGGLNSSTISRLRKHSFINNFLQFKPPSSAFLFLKLWELFEVGPSGLRVVICNSNCRQKLLGSRRDPGRYPGAASLHWLRTYCRC